VDTVAGSLAERRFSLWIAGLLYGVSPADLPTFTVVTTLLVGVGVVAS
jgi:hypothetical protein